MNIELREPDVRQKTRLKIIDVDIHPKSAMEDLKPYLSKRWWDHVQTFGARTRQGFLKGFPYPKSQPIASRRDSWPPGGGLPASDLNFMKQQYLDLYPIEYAIMNPLSPTGQGDQNEEFSIAMAFAANEFQLDGWNRRDPRLLASIVVPYEDAEASRKEIKRLKVAPMDTGDGGVYVMPDGSRAYLGLRDDHSVVAVNLKTLEVESRWAMGPDSGPGCINWAALR